MLEAFVLNPPRRRRARRSRGRGRRRRRNVWKNDTAGHRRAARKGWRRRRARKATRRRRRRRNPAASYGINRGRRRRRRRRNQGRHAAASYAINRGRRRRRRGRGRRRRRNQPASYGINRGRSRNPGGILGALTPSIPEVLPLPIKLPGIVNGIVQGALAGGVVFIGYVGSGFAVEQIEKLMGDTLEGKWRRPLLFGAIAGVMGGLAAILAPRGKKALWTVLAASGAGIRALAGVVKNVLDRPAETGMAQSAYDAVTGMADYIQVGEDLYEAGLDGNGTGLEDFIQVGEEAYEAGLDGMGEEEEEEEEVMVA